MTLITTEDEQEIECNPTSGAIYYRHFQCQITLSQKRYKTETQL